MVSASNSEEKDLPQQIRVSLGTAVVLGLLESRLDAEPTTAYLMTYRIGKCSANCGFCPQARTSQSKAEMLSRVTWPSFEMRDVLLEIESAVYKGKIKRVCIQALNYPSVFSELCAFVKALKSRVSVPVSVSCQPINSENIWSLAKAGVDRIGIALDAATGTLFDKVKGATVEGPYRWKDEFLLLKVAIGVFGEGNVSTHLIIGLGETEKEAANMIQQCVDMGVLPALFAFTPIRGTALAVNPRPKIEVYRRIQVARSLILNGHVRIEDMRFDDEGRLLDFGVSKSFLVDLVESGKPFLTSGCSDCNRPFYNEAPSGPLFNFPKFPTEEDIQVVKKQLMLD